MSLPNDIRPIERAEFTRRVWRVLHEDLDPMANGADLLLQLKLSNVRTRLVHAIRCLEYGSDLTSEERNAA